MSYCLIPMLKHKPLRYLTASNPMTIPRNPRLPKSPFKINMLVFVTGNFEVF